MHKKKRAEDFSPALSLSERNVKNENSATEQPPAHIQLYSICHCVSICHIKPALLIASVPLMFCPAACIVSVVTVSVKLHSALSVSALTA